MRGTSLVRGTRLSPMMIVVGSLVAVFGMLLVTGCADTEQSDAEARSEAREDMRPVLPLPAVITEQRPILPDGPPSAVFANEDFGIQFRHHAFLQRNLAPGRGFGTVTLRYGSGRIVITTYDEPMATRNLTSELRLAVETHYRGAVFPAKSPRLTRIGNSSIPQPRTHGMTRDWTLREPDPVASEQGLEGEDEKLAYTQFRIDTWEQFKRDEAWLMEEETWTPFSRTSPEGIQFEGLSGVAYVDGQRYLVTLEAAGDIHRPVHIVYIYPYEDYPVMREVIATLHETMRIN